MDLAVIGMGISGLLTTLQLSLNKHADRIVIYERRHPDAIPRKHCTGIISRETLIKIPYASKFIENSYSYVNVNILNKLDVNLIFDKNTIYKIDRVAHEKYLAEVVESKGVEIKFGKHVSHIKRFQSKYRVEGIELRSELFDTTIIAEGYPPKLSRESGLEAFYKPLKSIQQNVHLDKKLSYELSETVFTYLGLNGDGFAWFAPINENNAVVGVAVKDNAIHSLNLALRIFEKKIQVGMKRLGSIYGGIVLRGYPKRIAFRKVFGIGDTVAMVKSLSGGGLYAISIVSKIYGNLIHKQDLISKNLSTLVKELKQQYVVYQIIGKMLQSSLLPKTLSRKKIVIEVYGSYFYDHHNKLLIKLITDPSIWFSILTKNRPEFESQSFLRCSQHITK